MAKAFDPRKVLKQIANPLLRVFFERRGELTEIAWDQLTEHKIEPVFEAWQALPERQRQEVQVILRDINELADHRGMAVLAEEILWRGLVPSLVEERVGSRRAWMVSAGLYALAHLPVAWALRVGDAGLNPVIPLAALGCGLVWGGMARRFGRLWPGIFSHILFDWAAVMMFRFWGPSL